MEFFSKVLIDAARGIVPADCVFRNAQVFNPFICAWEEGDLALKNGLVLGIGDYSGKKMIDLKGGYVVPGLIDSHAHIESSLLTPREYARLVVLSGTTTVIADPHEIANVAGKLGIEFMLAERVGADVDILYMLPSCVPTTPDDIGGATLGASDLGEFAGYEGVLGLGEMMNVPGVLVADPEILEKLASFEIRDGHAPFLTGNDLNAYILAGLQSDHECTLLEEADEKLKRGMHIFIREGSTERNIADLISLVTTGTVSRFSFATDDCHADLLMEKGHIDRCIRKSIECGLEPELAIRMATLSAAERFGLHDRGALVPGRRGDFCIINNPERFDVKKVYRSGAEIIPTVSSAPPDFHGVFRSRIPKASDIRISGSGQARVIGLVPHQIITESLLFDCAAEDLPDIERDILKVVVCSRYVPKACGIGLVHGFGLKRGALASSVSHDAHNIVAVGTNDDEILRAIGEVISCQGAMAAVMGTSKAILPLDCAGLMSTLDYRSVVARLHAIKKLTESMEGISDPFMYLSFLALTVIPSLRITIRGVFDASGFQNVPLFV
jgi:adenine deaminase